MIIIFYKGEFMQDFIIRQINKEYAKYLVFGTTVESPLFQLFEIQNRINILNGEKIIFDQLLQTGTADNRFLIMTFYEGNFDYSSAQNIDAKNIENDVKALSCNFLRENSLILKYSILLSDQKEHILNGGNI